jgi:hypothetical protein
MICINFHTLHIEKAFTTVCQGLIDRDIARVETSTIDRKIMSAVFFIFSPKKYQNFLLGCRDGNLV